MRLISEVMAADVKVVAPSDPVHRAAQLMAAEDIGALPVCNGQRLQGIITDRDIAIRAVAEGLGADTPVADVMTEEIVTCREDEDTQTVLARMSEHQIRRLPVIDGSHRLVGIVTLGDLAIEDEDNVDETLREISLPG